MEIQTPGDVDDDEAEWPTVGNSRWGERVRSKPDTFAFTTNSERDISGSKDISASDMGEHDGVDTHFKTAVLTAALGGDAIAHYACIVGLAGIKPICDYPEPQNHNEALATLDAEN